MGTQSGSLKAAVFCSSSRGLSASIESDVVPFVEGLKARGAAMVYGGGRAGLMGLFADTALKNGVEVFGAITKRLDSGFEVAHRGITKLEIVDDLFDRKRYFIRESDAFFIFPGGFGTLDEALEVMTWKGLGELDKPICFVNIDGFWDKTLESFRDLSSRGVIRSGAFDDFQVVASSQEALTWWDQVLKVRRNL